MAYWRKKRKDISDGIPFPRVPNPFQISAYIKKILKLNSAEFFELEPMEVEKTNLDGYTQGAILGKFINARKTKKAKENNFIEGDYEDIDDNDKKI